MPVPNSMADLSTLASSNSPAGTEAIGNSLDNYIRAGYAIVRSTNAVASATIASASTTDIGLADGESVIITGTSAIYSFGPGFVGCFRELYFQSALTIVQGSSISTPTGANLAVTAGSTLGLRCTASGVWRVVIGTGYVPANRAGDTFTGDVTFNGSLNLFGVTGYMYKVSNGVIGVRSRTDDSVTSSFFNFKAVGGDFEALSGGMRAAAPVRATGRVYALAGDPNVGGFPSGLASGIDCNSSTGRGQLFGYNYGGGAFIPFDYNASSHTFNADLFCTGNITAYSSDARLKTGVVNASGRVIGDFFDRFRVREFDWDYAAISDLNPGFKPDAPHEVGAVAQEVEEVMPTMVGTYEKTGIKTIRWDKAMPLVIAEIQYLRGRVRDLEGGNGAA